MKKLFGFYCTICGKEIKASAKYICPECKDGRIKKFKEIEKLFKANPKLLEATENILCVQKEN